MSFDSAIQALGGSKYAGSISSAASKFGIATPLQRAHWLAQIAHESGRFQYVREIWGPTPQQLRYEPPSSLAAQLGNTEAGDGKKFKGRGFIQITGRSNYRQASKDLFGNELLLTKPEMLELDPALSAGWYWQTRKINKAADRDDVVAVTKLINGGLNGLADRKTCLAIAKKELGL